MPPARAAQDKVSQAPRPPRSWPVLAFLVILAALLPHLKSLDYDFVWDDKVMIGPALNVAGPADLVRLWRTPFDSLLRDPVLHNTYFRPVTLLSLALDRALYGSQPSGYHLTNLIAYAAACLFLWLFAWALTGKPGLAALGAAVFALP